MSAAHAATNSFNLSGTDQPEKVTAQRVTANYFEVLGVKPALGRTFQLDEDQPDRQRVIVLSHKLWERFGGDPKLIGHDVELDSEKYTVIGVLKPDSTFDRSAVQLFMPLVFDKPTDRRSHFLRVYGRLKPGVSRAQAQSDMESIAAAIGEQSPDTNKAWSVTIDSLRERVGRPALRQTLRVLFGAVIFILLIACANIVNLLTLRAASRYKEISIRAAVGAGRWRLVRQFLTESVLVALLGGSVGIALGAWLVKLFTTLMPPFTLPPEAEVTLDFRVLFFALGLSLLSGLVVGLIPARRASNTNLTEALKEGGKGAIAGSAGRISKVFIVAEVALALVLLTGAGLLVRNLFELRKTPLGFEPANLLTLRLSLPDSKYKTPQQVTTFFDEALRRMASLPGVDAVSLATDLPVTGWTYGAPFQVEGQPITDESRYISAHYQRISSDYFRALRIPITSGRSFTPQDNASSSPVLIINETLARRFFPNQNPIGKRIVLTIQKLTCEIVGVTANVHVYGLGDPVPQQNLEIYVPYAQDPETSSYIAVRTVGAPMQMASAVQRELQAVDKAQAVTDIKSMDDVVEQTLADKKFNTLLIGFFAAIAVVLAAVGIYGVISYAVAQHTREIGIRMALGAQAADVLKLVVGQGMLPVVVGLVIGLAGSFALTRVITSLLYAVSATDRPTFIVTPIMLAAIALLACLIPARRATKVDPTVA